MKRNPKIVVIGAGSATFGLPIWARSCHQGVPGATLALCDLNSEGLEQIRRLAERINQPTWWASVISSTSAT